MLTRRLARKAWAQALIAGCAALFGAGVLTGHAQAQTSAPATSAPGPAPAPPTQSPVVNPSNPSTAQQPSYKSLSPSTPSATPSTPNTTSSTRSSTPSTVPNTEATSPANEQPSNETAAQSERHAAKPRPVHRYRHRAALVTYSCSHLGCVRTYAWAFPCQYYSRSCYPYGRPYRSLYAYAAGWWPGYYDYAPGQFGRARYLGRGHRAGYWGD